MIIAAAIANTTQIPIRATSTVNSAVFASVELLGVSEGERGWNEDDVIEIAIVREGIVMS